MLNKFTPAPNKAAPPINQGLPVAAIVLAALKPPDIPLPKTLSSPPKSLILTFCQVGSIVDCLAKEALLPSNLVFAKSLVEFIRLFALSSIARSSAVVENISMTPGNTVVARFR